MKVKKVERLSHVMQTQLLENDLHAVEAIIRKKKRGHEMGSLSSVAIIYKLISLPLVLPSTNLLLPE